MPKVIIDASFLRGAKADGSQLLALVGQDYLLVVMDALLFELLSTDRPEIGRAAVMKLGHVVDHLEVWEHVGVMLNTEITTQQPYGSPSSSDLTERVRAFVRQGASCEAESLRRAVNETRGQREGCTLDTLFNSFPAVGSWICGLSDKIRNRPLDDPEVTKWCREVVNSRDIIMKFATQVAGPDVGEAWIAYHVAKSYLAMFCDHVRQGATCTADIQGKARKRWVNRKHDLDYLICLAFADALASNESAGEQNAYRLWMYGDSKPLIRL